MASSLQTLSYTASPIAVTAKNIEYLYSSLSLIISSLKPWMQFPLMAATLLLIISFTS